MKSIRLTCAAAFAAIALSATAGASPAAASYLTFGEYPATYGGDGKSLVITLGGREVNCEARDFFGSAGGPSQELETQGFAGATNCSWFNGSVKLDMKSCDFILHPGNPNGSIEIGPAGCGGATLTSSECTWSIPAQKAIATTYANQPTEPASVEMQTGGSMAYSVVSGSSFVCGSKGTLSGGFYASWTVTGYLHGAPISAAVTDNPPVGIFLTGSQLAAESYPVTLGGEQSASAKRTFNFASRTVTCDQASVAGSAGAASSSFELSPSYSNCTAVVLGNLLPATVDASGCTEEYTVTASSAPYTASLDLTCSSPLTVTVTSGGVTACTYTIGTQTGLGTVNLANTGSGLSRGVDVGWQLGSLSFTRTAGTLATCGGSGGKGVATASGTAQLRGSF